MSGEVEKCPILHVRLKFDVFTLSYSICMDYGGYFLGLACRREKANWSLNFDL